MGAGASIQGLKAARILCCHQVARPSCSRASSVGGGWAGLLEEVDPGTVCTLAYAEVPLDVQEAERSTLAQTERFAENLGGHFLQVLLRGRPGTGTARRSLAGLIRNILPLPRPGAAFHDLLSLHYPHHLPTPGEGFLPNKSYLVRQLYSGHITADSRFNGYRL